MQPKRIPTIISPMLFLDFKKKIDEFKAKCIKRDWTIVDKS